MTNPSYFRELMLRAPAVPEWYEPEGFKGPHIVFSSDEMAEIQKPNADLGPYYKKEAEYKRNREREKILQWPSYYAREVIKAAGGEAKGQRMPNALAGYLYWNEHWIKPGYLNLASYKVWNGEAWVNPDDFKGETHTSYEDRP